MATERTEDKTPMMMMMLQSTNQQNYNVAMPPSDSILLYICNHSLATDPSQICNTVNVNAYSDMYSGEKYFI